MVCRSLPFFFGSYVIGIIYIGLNKMGETVLTTQRQTYRLRPSKSVIKRLEKESSLSRYVWNKMVEKSKDDYVLGISSNYKDYTDALTIMRNSLVDDDGIKWLYQGSSVVQQQTVRNFINARSEAIKKNRGFPKFKKRDVWLPSLEYTKRGFRITEIDGKSRLVLAGKLVIPVVWSQNLHSNPTSVRVYRDSIGHWYASFVVSTEQSPYDAMYKSSIGVDWGVRETATTARYLSDGTIDTSNEYDLPHVGYGAKVQRDRTQAQRIMARRHRKGKKNDEQSNGYRLAKFKSARVAKKAQRQRKDAAHKWARKIVHENARIAVENFKPAFLAKSNMARKAADGAIATYRDALLWQAKKAGREIVIVPAAYSTMDCSKCGARAKHRLDLSERVYSCSECGLVLPRDKNSALVMLNRAGFNPGYVDDQEGQTLVSPEPILV
jgi:putative transposase